MSIPPIKKHPYMDLALIVDWEFIMKKEWILVLCCFSLISCMGCSDKSHNSDVSSSYDSNDAVTSCGSEENSGSAMENSKIAEKEYSAAYYNVIRELCEEYGFYSNYTSDGYAGFLKGRLIDYDKDGIPEFVCIFLIPGQQYQTVNLYAFDRESNAAGLLLTEQAGNALYGDHVAEIDFCVVDNTPYLLIENSSYGTTEQIFLYSVKNHILGKKAFYADVTSIEIDGWPEPQYDMCKIDDEVVSETEYDAEKSRFTSNMEWWGYPNDSSEATIFVQSLAAAAEISTESLNALLQNELAALARERADCAKM